MKWIFWVDGKSSSNLKSDWREFMQFQSLNSKSLSASVFIFFCDVMYWKRRRFKLACTEAQNMCVWLCVRVWVCAMCISVHVLRIDVVLAQTNKQTNKHTLTHMHTNTPMQFSSGLWCFPFWYWDTIFWINVFLIWLVFKPNERTNKCTHTYTRSRRSRAYTYFSVRASNRASVKIYM